MLPIYCISQSETSVTGKIITHKVSTELIQKIWSITLGRIVFKPSLVHLTGSRFGSRPWSSGRSSCPSALPWAMRSTSSALPLKVMVHWLCFRHTVKQVTWKSELSLVVNKMQDCVAQFDVMWEPEQNKKSHFWCFFNFNFFFFKSKIKWFMKLNYILQGFSQ